MRGRELITPSCPIPGEEEYADGVYASTLRDNTELELHLPFDLNEACFKERWIPGNPVWYNSQISCRKYSYKIFRVGERRDGSENQQRQSRYRQNTAG